MNRLSARNRLSGLIMDDDSFPAPRTTLQRYGIAVLALVFAMLLSLLFHSFFVGIPFMPFFLALAVSAGYGGLGPGLLVALLTIPFVGYFMRPPYFAFEFDVTSLIEMAAFTLTALVISGLYAARQRAAESQREARKQFEIILGGVVDGVTVQSLNGNLTYANDAAARMTNFPTAEALITAPMTEILSDFEVLDEAGNPLPPEKFPNSLALQGMAAQTVVRFRTTSTGVERWSVLKSTPVFDEHGKVYQSVNLFQDITALKQAQQAAFDQHEQLRVTLASIGDGVIATDTAGKVTFINNVAAKLTGWLESDAVGQDVESVFHIVNEDTRAVVANPIRRVLAEGIIVGLANHTVLIARDGTETPIDDSGAPIHTADGALIGTILVFRNIAARRQTEDELSFRANILRNVQESIIATDLQGKITYWNEGAERIFGYSAAEMLGQSLSLLYENTSSLNDDLQAIQNGADYRGEWQGKRKDGTPIWVDIHTTILQDARGVTIGFLGVANDITEHKLTEERYKLLAEALPQFVWVGPTEGSAEFCNRFWYEYTGLSVEQTMSAGWTDALHPADHERMQERWQQASEEGAAYELELRFRRASDGDYRWHLARIFPLHDAAGKIYKWLGTATDIHERKQAQVELQAAHRQVVDILESISDAFYTVDEDWRFTYVNRRAEQVWDRKRENLIGKSIWDEFPETVGAYPYQQLQRVAKERQPLEFESLSPVRQTWIEITVYPGEKGISVYFRDIHERKQAQQRAAVLQEITAELSSAVTPVQVAEIVVNKGVAALGGHIGSITLLSEDEQHLEVLTSHGMDESIVSRYRRISLDGASPLSDAVRLRQPIWIETQEEYTSRYPSLAEIVRQITGSRASVSLPLIVNQRVIGGMGISFKEPRHFSDGDRALLIALAQQCAQALERARLYEAEAHARAQAEAANELKMRFLAMISHELRTPLTSIKGFATTLLAEDVTWDAASQREFLLIIDEESDKLKELIEQLLDVSRLQSGTLRVNTEPQPLSRSVERALTQIQTLTAAHTFDLQMPNDLPMVLADEQRIAQVLVNLVDNATKYSPQQTRITVKAQQAGDFVQIDVSDEGEGIPEEDRGNVFEAFHQVERKSQSQMGAGLGLAICKGLIEAHGGRIWIVDDRHSGTTISFTLPIVQSEPD